jgi:hypothetical protein
LNGVLYDKDSYSCIFAKIHSHTSQYVERNGYRLQIHVRCYGYSYNSYKQRHCKTPILFNT